MSLINYLDDMALAIKEKSGYEGKMKYSEMPEKIRELAFEDPTQVYKNNSVILRKGGLFVGENSNVAILDLGEPEYGKPTYTRFDLQPYYEGQETSGITVAVINDGLGNVYSLNTEIDHISSNSDGSAYTIKYSGDEQNAIEVVETDFESSHGILFGENGYTCEVPHYDTSETAIVKFGSSGIACEMIYGDDGDLFYSYVNSSGEKYYQSTHLEDHKTYVLYAKQISGNTGITHSVEAPNGFAFITSSGANQTYDGYNYIQFLNSSGEEFEPNEITEGTYSITYNSGIDQWQMRESLGPDLNEQSLYYYYLSSGKPTFNEVDLDSNRFYYYEGYNWFTPVTGLNNGVGIYFYNGNPSNPTFSGSYQGFTYYYGSGGVDTVTHPEFSSSYLYAYHYGDNFTEYEVDSGEIWQITGDSSVGYGMTKISDDLWNNFVYQYDSYRNILTELSSGIYQYRGNGDLTLLQDAVYIISSGDLYEQYISVGAITQYNGNSLSPLAQGVYNQTGSGEPDKLTLPVDASTPTTFNNNGHTYTITFVS